MENYSAVVRNCNVPCCHGKHYIKFNENGIAIIPVWELFQIERYWEKNFKSICDVVCSSKPMCLVHRKLKIFKHFTEDIRNRNLNQNIIAEYIYLRDNCPHPFCMNSWCFNIQKTKWLPSDAGLSVRSKYL